MIRDDPIQVDNTLGTKFYKRLKRSPGKEEPGIKKPVAGMSRTGFCVLPGISTEELFIAFADSGDLAQQGFRFIFLLRVTAFNDLAEGTGS